MKKIHWATHKTLFKQIATYSCLVAVSAGVVFGVSAGSFKIQYSDLTKVDDRLNAAITSNYYAQNISSQWNMTQSGIKGDKGYVAGYEQPIDGDITRGSGLTWWKKLHGNDAIPLHENDSSIPGTDPKDMDAKAPRGRGIDDKAEKARRQYTALIIDGATKTQLDRSFNQSVYNGMINFIKNQPSEVVDSTQAIAYKPSQDSTTEFVNVYNEALRRSRILSLAGFCHITPLNTLYKVTPDGKADFGSDKYVSNAGYILIDGDMAHNQNISSVLFRCDQSAFLTALATCMYFLNNLEQYHKGYRDISVGTYGGVGMPTVTIYMGGFQRGIEFYNEFILKQKIINHDAFRYMINTSTVDPNSHFIKHILPASKYKTEIETVKKQQRTPTKEEKVKELCENLYSEFSIKMIKFDNFKQHFTGTFAPGDAIGITKQFLNRGASAILPVCGAQYIDTTQEIMNQNANCIAIGVDCSLENSDFQRPFKKAEYKDKTVAPDGTTPSHASDIVKFSAVKDITTATEKVLRNAMNGVNWDVTNKERWNTGTTIPPWDPKTEEISIDQIKTVENQDGTVDVIGFKKGFVLPKGQHVLNIPTKIGNKSVYAIRAAAAYEDADAFDAKTLMGIDTLKISDDGTSSIVFKPKAFNYCPERIEPTELAEIMKNSGFRYIDMSQLDVRNIHIDGITTTPASKIFAGIAGLDNREDAYAFHRGVIKFNQYDYSQNAKKLFNEFFGQNQITLSQDWPIIEADPLKSVCGFGFRTCGNIENGLSSISQDGWPYVVDALNQLDYNITDPDHPGDVSFFGLLSLAGEIYEQEARATAPEFFDAIRKLTVDNYYQELCSFNKDKIWYKYYPQTMAWLGTMLKIGGLQFPREMTIRFDSNGKPIKLPAGTTSMPFTILDWLRTNMYYIC